MKDSLATLKVEIGVSSSTLTSCRIEVPKGMTFGEASRKMRYAIVELERQVAERTNCPAYSAFSEGDREALSIVHDAAKLIRERKSAPQVDVEDLAYAISEAFAKHLFIEDLILKHPERVRKVAQDLTPVLTGLSLAYGGGG